MIKSREVRKNMLMGNLTVKELCEWFVRTNTEDKKETPMLRGWIMDELERRNVDGFNYWMDTENLDLLDNPTSFFL